MIDFTLMICVFAGFILGIFSGLTPGLHVNNFAALLLAATPMLMGLGMKPEHIAMTILAASISQTFLDIVPAVFVGAPDADTALAVLPGQKMMLEGRGMEAIRLSAAGSAGSIIVALILIYPLAWIFSNCYDQIMKYAGLILLEIAALMILTETCPKIEGQGSLAAWKYKFLAAIIFMTSGILGTFAFNHEAMISSPEGFEPQVLLPLLSGLFGASSLIISISTKAKIPPQRDTEFDLPVPKLSKSILLGSIGGSLVAWFPGISASVATISTRFGKESSGEEFLVSISGVNTANAVFSLVALYVIEKPRSGAAAAIDELVSLDHSLMMQMLVTLVAVAFASYLATILLGKAASITISRLNYRALCTYMLLGLSAMTLILTGPFGLMIFFISTVVGMIAPLAGVRKTHAMGALMLPLILRYI
jgi:putative membrane protein